MIGPNSTVQVHFDIRLKDGSIADGTRSIGRPMEFTLGTGVFHEKLETALLGLQAGDKKKVMLLPEEAFGEAHPANIFQVPVNRFQQLDEPLEVGMIIMFTEANGNPRPGIIQAIEGTEATVDFNHPLAGQVVLFDIEIITVLEP